MMPVIKAALLPDAVSDAFLRSLLPNTDASNALKHIVGGHGKQLAWLARLVPGLVRRQLAAAERSGKAPGS